MNQKSKKNMPGAGAGIENLLKKNDPVPAANAVDPDRLMNGMIGEIVSYLVISEYAALAVVLWCIHTWCYNEFSRSPLLLINAPERACGKTQLLKIVEKLVPRPLDTANITIAGLFRIIEQYKPTLLIDEADTFMEAKSEMAGLLNKGYERGGVVIRVETDKNNAHEPRTFHVFGPKALAGIALQRHLADATMSRGIQVPLKRKTKNDQVKRLRAADPQVFSTLRSNIQRFVNDHREILAQGWDELPEQLDDRQQDNWEPLLAIAHCMGDEWYRKSIEAAVTLCAETAPPKSASNQLLEDIREVLGGYKDRYIPTAELLELLHDHPDMDWCRYNHGQALTSRQLAKYLGAYSIKPKTVRMKDGSTPKGYEVRQFDEAFNRYLPEIVPEAESEEPNVGGVNAEKPAALDALRTKKMALQLPPRQDFWPVPTFQAKELAPGQR